VQVVGFLCAALLGGCASAVVFAPPGVGDAATEQGPGKQDLAGFVAPDAAADLSVASTDASGPHDLSVHHDLAMPASGLDMTESCATYVAPTPCATSGGLNVYCIAPGGGVALESSVSIPSSDSFVALGPGSVAANGSNLGYLSASVPLTCATVPACSDPSSVQNTGGICDVIFKTGSASTVTGTGLFVIRATSTATPGDYLLGYLSQAVVTSPNFYIRVQ
jgi:hypothetical protein